MILCAKNYCLRLSFHLIFIALILTVTSLKMQFIVEITGASRKDSPLFYQIGYSTFFFFSSFFHDFARRELEFKIIIRRNIICQHSKDWNTRNSNIWNFRSFLKWKHKKKVTIGIRYVDKIYAFHAFLAKLIAHCSIPHMYRRWFCFFGYTGHFNFASKRKKKLSQFCAKFEQ